VKTLSRHRATALAAALALGGFLSLGAAPLASAAPAAALLTVAPPVHADISSPAGLPVNQGVANGDNDYLLDVNTTPNSYVFGPDKNPDQATLTTNLSSLTYFELELKSGVEVQIGNKIYDTYWLCSNGSAHHCLQDEDGPVDVEDYAATGGQYWFFYPEGSGKYYICNYYWSVHNGGDSTCMYDDDGYVAASVSSINLFELT
jgi:hypothetical protein